MSSLPVGIRFLEVAFSATGLMIQWCLQSTLVFAVGLTVGFVLRRRGPALQSAIYRTTLAVAVTCPLVGSLLSATGLRIPSVALPSIPAVAVEVFPEEKFPLPPALNRGDHDDLVPSVQSNPAATNGEDELPRFARSDDRPPESGLAPWIVHGTPVAPGLPASTESPPGSSAAESAAVNPPSDGRRSRWAIRAVPAIAVVGVSLVWLLGSAAFLARLVLDLFRLVRLQRSATPASEEQQHLCRELASQMGVRAPRLLRTPFIGGPCLSGIRHAAILLPEEFFDLPLAAVLVHELAHLRRGDCRWNLIRQVSVALLFWQPLAWRLSRRMAEVAEEVCDDHVVHWGGDRTIYASGLVRLAEQRTLPISTVVPLVTFRSLLGQRVQRILDRSHRLSLRAGMKALCAVATVGMAVTLLVCSFASNRRIAAASPPNEAQKSDTAEKNTSDSGNAEKGAGENENTASKKPAEATKSADMPDAAKRVSGTVLLPNGKLAADAQVVLIGRLRQAARAIDFASQEPIVIGRQECDAAGCFEIPAADLSSARYVWVQLLARSADSALDWRGINADSPETNCSIKLLEALPARGRLVTLEGQPAAGIHVMVSGVVRKQTPRSGLDDSANSHGATFPAEVWPSGVITDANGWFSVPGIAAGAEVNLRVDQEPYAPEWWNLDPGSTEPAKSVHTLTPAQIIKGVVIAADSGKPIENAPVHVNPIWEPGMHGMIGAEGKTDAEGRFRINPYAARGFEVTTFGPAATAYLANQAEFKWGDTEREHQLRIELPRGVLVHGTITEEASGEAVAGAAVRYTARENNPHAKVVPLGGIYQPTELSDRKGRFSIAVPAGAGHLTVKGTSDYVLKEADQRQLAVGKPGGYALPVHADASLDFPADARDLTVNFRLRRGVTVAGQIVRADGQPPERIIMQHRGTTFFCEEFRADSAITLAGGRFEIHGVPADGEVPIYFLDPDAKQGKLFTARGSYTGKPMVVKLDPCGSLALRFLDPDSKPLAGHAPTLLISFLPGKLRANDRDRPGEIGSNATFIQNFDRVNCWDLTTDESGRITYPTLIPGATYGLQQVSDNRHEVLSAAKYHEITVNPGQRMELPDIVIRNPDVLRYAEEERMKKQKEQAAKGASAAPTGNTGASPPEMPTGTFSSVEVPTVEKAKIQAAAEKQARGAGGAANKKPSGGISGDSPLQIRGQVVDPDGKPATGAKLFILHSTPGRASQRELKPWAMSGSDGRFEFAIKRSDLDAGTSNEWLFSRIVATADGLGMAAGSLCDFVSSGSAQKHLSAALLERLVQREAGRKSVLRLVSDNAPITGRIVSLEGQPIAGVQIALKEILCFKQESLDGWEKAAKEPKADYYSLRGYAEFDENAAQLPFIVPVVTTDRDGRFTMHGIGRERIVRLTVSGSGIETKLIWTRTRKGEKVVVPNEWRYRAGGRNEEYFGNGFTHVAAPSNAVGGRVTDRETGKPLAGVTVMSQMLHGTPLHGWGQDYIRAVTDADGRYRLEGMPLGDDNELGAFTMAQPYLAVGKRVRIDVGSEPVKLDFQLPRGIWVEGRVTDKTTGEPISGTVEYCVFVSNPYYKKLGRLGWVDLREYHRAGPDGRFRIAALPGRGIIGVMAEQNEKYSTRGAGAEQIEGGDTKGGVLMFPTYPHYCDAFNYNALAGIDPPANADVVKLDLTLASGATVTGRLIDADGKPVVGAIYCGDSPAYEHWRSCDEDSFQLNSYEPLRPRRLIFYEQKRNLAAVYMLQGEPPKTLVVRLEPAGSVRGRVVDAHGSPMAGVDLWRGVRSAQETMGLSAIDLPLPIPTPDLTHGRFGPSADDRGRFEIHGLVPGHDYAVQIFDGAKNRIEGQFPKPFSVQAGETKDLGDIAPSNTVKFAEAMQAEAKVKAKASAGDGAKSDRKTDAGKADAKPAGKSNDNEPAAPAPASPTNSTEASHSGNDDLLSVRGRVIDPNGKPVAGAEVAPIQSYWRISRTSVALITVKSDAEGRFHLVFHKSQFIAYGVEPWRSAVIAAFSPDSKLGAAWCRYDSIKPGDGITLQLVPNEPIEGRIVDLEGKPIAGVDVKVTDLTTNASSDLTTWLGALKRGIPFFGSQAYGQPDRWLPADFFNRWHTKTDSDGYFRLTGVGRDRVADVDVSGAGIVSTNLRIVARPMGSIKADTSSNGFPDSTMYYGSHAQIAVEPSQPIEGVVRDAKTGKPLAGVRVVADKLAGRDLAGIYSNFFTASVTDEQGNYRIDGLPKGTGNGVLALPADGQPYFIREFDVPTGPGFQTVKFDLDLHRGALIHGRVTDNVAGKPVDAAWMHYIPWPNNPNLQDAPEFGHGSLPGPQDRYQTDHDGRFTLIGLPGRGLIEVERGTRPFPPGQGRREIADLPTQQEFLTVAGVLMPRPNFPTAVKDIHIGGTEDQIDLDIQLDPGKRITLEITDPDGKPLAGVQADGLGPYFAMMTRKDAGPTVDVLALESEEKRLVMLFQKERNLGKAVRVCWKDLAPGPITVKLEPCAALKARLLDNHGDPIRGETISIGAREGGYSSRLPDGGTDSDGRVNYTTLLPGVTYFIACNSKQTKSLCLVEKNLTVSPGETIDLGEFDVTTENHRPKPIRSNAMAPR